MTKILIVDDNEMDRVLVTHLLSGLYEFVYASDGDEGLEVCKSEQPDLVIVDLIMPNMGGMQMLTEMKTQYPEVPVIMMTSAGSESTAAEAMKRGAASYVPKRYLPDRLGQTVDQAVELMRTNRDYVRLLHRLTYCRYIYELENDFTLIEPLVEFVQQIAFAEGICDQHSKHRLGIALDEALFNAMYHGNLKLPAEHNQLVRNMARQDVPIPLVDDRRKDPVYEDRRVLVYITCSFGKMKIVIEDQGEGFDHARFSDADGSGVDHDQQRGILMIKSIMDEVVFNEAGNRLTLVKTRDSSLALT